MPSVFRLSSATVIDLVGQDAGAILHNLTTNEIKSLPVGTGCETFITEVRGKMLAYVDAFRTAEGYRMIGAGGQAEVIASHADRYTIREDAQPVDLSEQLTVFVVAPDAHDSIRVNTNWDEYATQVYPVQWLGSGTLLLVTARPEFVEQQLSDLDQSWGDQDAFHHARTLAGFPWFGIDLSDKNLPQEASRIEQTISFTKGCYLGQETVARLDALGQVQKQLMQWQSQGSIPAPASEVSSDGKVVGRLTSIAATSENTAVAIGVTRRSHFEPGSTAQGDGFTATTFVNP
ncbi:aminomethyltransferase [Stieleria sp. TO1_6]|uniref:CAF17-like 4Fe-4S cluster assembly/insertion protein YgfZ n=1 Tax=Stieleria tagensis TaxID=2956795 RepID=UPI00209B2645|nr:aminomethyltransferase [Stieleria tagensis]MCO8123672.1 aminomethyltransferase [Stieleria tagensis]